MKATATSLEKILEGVVTSYRADIRRAQKDRNCSNLSPASVSTTVARLQDLIQKQIAVRIMKSIRVCGNSCVVVSFDKEVKAIRDRISSLARDAKQFSRNVVQCAVDSRINSADRPNTRTDERLSDLINGLQKVKTRCKVCRK